MAFSLSFSPEFFFGEGEPYDCGEWYTNEVAQPTTLWSAIGMMRENDPKAWEAMCEDCFPDCDPEIVDLELVLELIQETDTCSDLRSPVEVWIDSEGWHRVKVW